MTRWNPHGFVWFVIAVVFGGSYWFFADATFFNFGVSVAIIVFVLMIVERIVEGKWVYMFTKD